MADRTCSVEGCERKALCRGWCSGHYQRWHTHGDVDASTPLNSPYKGALRMCVAAGCTAAAVALGYCRKHYKRWRRWGDPLGQRPQRAVCTVDGCERPVNGHGLCMLHYTRWRRYGDPLVEVVARRRRVADEPKVTAAGCGIGGCGRSVVLDGYCEVHCAAATPRVHLTRRGLSLEERLWRRIDKTGPHWLWQGAVTKEGYGHIAVGPNGRPSRPVHRVVYELTVGPIPDGYVIDHLCRVRHCVNPAHLEPVTPAENARRARKEKHCWNCGAPLFRH